MEWAAIVSLGRADATIEGTGAINLLDLVADAVGSSGVTLNQVVIIEANKFMIGYELGSAKGMMATIQINYRPLT